MLKRPKKEFMAMLRLRRAQPLARWAGATKISAGHLYTPTAPPVYLPKTPFTTQASLVTLRSAVPLPTPHVMTLLTQLSNTFWSMAWMVSLTP